MYDKISEDIRKLIRDECHNIFKDMSSKINNQISDNHTLVTSRILALEEKNEKVTIKLDELNDIVNTDKAYVDRIQDLLNFQKKANDQMNSHELRISNVTKSLKDTCYKYDKIYLDNLCIPGIIGEFCRFKSIRDYIEVKII